MAEIQMKKKSLGGRKGWMLRRGLQSACLALFLVLLFYVAWPYSAHPSRTWSGWVPLEVDGQTGRATLEADAPPLEPLDDVEVLYVRDESASEHAHLGAFRVLERSERNLVVEPAERLAGSDLERLTLSFGPWSLAESPPGQWPDHYAQSLQAKEILPAELFLILDPLVSLSAAVGARSWIWSLTAAAAILLVCLVVPRGFCAYVCPLGSLIDLFDWAIGRRLRVFRRVSVGWWRNLRYYLLATVLGAALAGVLLSGFVAAIPVITRGLVFTIAPVQTGLMRGWHQVPPMGWGHAISIGLLALVLGLGLLRPRFWCKFVCPSGALFSIGNLLRLVERRVEGRCTACGRCAADCPFDAIDAEGNTRPANCALCRTCSGACPAEAVRYVPRWRPEDSAIASPADNRGSADDAGVPPADATTTAKDASPVARRGFLGSTAAAVAAGLATAWGTRVFARRAGESQHAVRPPGSVPEPQFLAMCVRCGECFRACPNDALQPLGFQQGWEGLWTPQLRPDWSGCEVSCNLCGQVCPTGAIRALALEEKRFARIGLAVVDRETCLPFAGVSACQLCVDECNAAGYRAIEFMQVRTEVDAAGNPMEGTGLLAPVVSAEKCVGCGLCQTRCLAINATQKGLLVQSAIRVEAGPEKEDRLLTGSYRQRRENEARRREADRRQRVGENSVDAYRPE